MALHGGWGGPPAESTLVTTRRVATENVPGEEAPPSLHGMAGRGQGMGHGMLLASVGVLGLLLGPLSQGQTLCTVPTAAWPVERNCLQHVYSRRVDWAWTAEPLPWSVCPHPCQPLLAWFPGCPPQRPCVLSTVVGLPRPQAAQGKRVQVEAARWSLLSPASPGEGSILSLCPGSCLSGTGRGTGGLHQAQPWLRAANTHSS